MEWIVMNHEELVDGLIGVLTGMGIVARKSTRMFTRRLANNLSDIFILYAYLI